MVTAAQILVMIQTVVEAHATHNTFYSIWSPAKDANSEPVYPCVIEHRYIGRVIEDPNLGTMHRSQLVQLLVVTSVATDRTVAQRAAAVHAADTAAIDIVLGLKAAYSDYIEVGNVTMTPEWDERATLETGVLLTFTVKSIAGACVVADPGELPSLVPASFTLGDLSDVDTTGAVTGNALLFDGTTWGPGTVSGGGGGGVTDHGALTGLGDDDHTQYHNNARGDVRYDALGAASTAQAAAIAAAATDATTKANAAQSAAATDATTKANAAQAASQPLDSDLTAYANAADAAARRALIGAGVGDVTGGGTASGTNTGDQDLSPYQTISGLAAAVRSTVLTGLSLATNQAIAAGDTILQAFGYLQAQITDRFTKAESDARYMSFGVATVGQTGFATDTLITGSVVAIPSGGLKAGTAYRLRCSLNKTAAGVATPIFQVRLGTNGTTADTSQTTLTFGAGTAAADDGVFELMVTFRSVGGGTSAVIVAHGVISHRLNTTGLTNGSYNAVTGNLSAGFDSTTPTFISVSLNAGTSAAWTILQAHAQLFNQN